MATEQHGVFEIQTRPGWTGGVTAAVYCEGRLVRTFHGIDREAALQKARRWVESKKGGGFRETN